MNPTRFLFELLILAGLFLIVRKAGKKGGRRRKSRRRRKKGRIRLLENKLFRAVAAAAILVFVVIPYGFGLVFPQLRYFPTYLESHKLLLTYGAATLLTERVWPSGSVEEILRRETSRQGVEWALARAILEAESGGRQFAVSSTGAMGYMQLMPGTYYSLRGGNPFSAENNIAAGVAYLKQLQQRFNGDLRLVAAAYNAGPSLVESCRCVPQNGQTPRYVKKVLAHYRRFGGNAAAVRRSESWA